MNGPLDKTAAVLDAYRDMLKGILGDQFAVSIVARHKSGPCHLLIGDDDELAMIACLSELQRVGQSQKPDSVVETHLGDIATGSATDTSTMLLTEVHGDPLLQVTATATNSGLLDVGDMADAPAVDGRPEGMKPVCARCVEPLLPGQTNCPVCGHQIGAST